MFCKENYLGKIFITDKFLKKLVEKAVCGTFGVAAMTRRPLRRTLLGRFIGDNLGKNGIIVRNNEDKVTAHLHISVAYGTSILAVVNSIKEKVTFVISEYTGMAVESVNVYVDGII